MPFLFMIVFIPSSNVPFGVLQFLMLSGSETREREKIRTQLMSSSPSIKGGHAWKSWTQYPPAVSFEANRRDDRMPTPETFVKGGNGKHKWDASCLEVEVFNMEFQVQDAHG
ncbi:hypothetical protein GGI42DRAFT_337041 [Trichoderma sp. SZMC 28013]